MERKNKSLFIIFSHVFLGVIAKFFAPAFTAYYLAIILWGFYRVFSTNDRGHCAARFGLYVMGLEILYRMGGFTISHELAKYASALLFFCGMLVSAKRSDYLPFLLYLLLLLPAVLLTQTDEGLDSYRKMILFNMSGPISLAFSGMYFYKRRISERYLWTIMRWAVYPAISVVVLLFLGARVSAVDLSSNSNFALSGGFGPNQVSTALGFFLLVLIFAVWNQKVLTYNRWTDYLLIGLVLIRGFFTFSRGGLFAVALAVLCSVVALIVTSQIFRERLGRFGLTALFLGVFFSGIFLLANKMTDNWLLSRYQGKSTTEVNTGIKPSQEKAYLTGRVEIAAAELELFKKNWLTGVGIGMSKAIREKKYTGHKAMVSHFEIPRMLSEHGSLGAIAVIFLLIIYPLKQITSLKCVLARQFFVLFFVLGVLMATHSAMRMAFPGVIIGFAFALIVPNQGRKFGLTEHV